MSTKNLIRIVVVLGLLAWPGIEVARLWSTNQKLQQAQALEKSVATNLASAKAKHAQLAGTDAPSPK